MDRKLLIGIGGLALVTYLALRRSKTVYSAEVNTISATPTMGAFSPNDASIVSNAYLEVPLANDALMESYSMQGSRNPNGWTPTSLVGNKYVEAMQSSGMLDSYQGIYGVVGA